MGSSWERIIVLISWISKFREDEWEEKRDTNNSTISAGTEIYVEFLWRYPL